MFFNAFLLVFFLEYLKKFSIKYIYSNIAMHIDRRKFVGDLSPLAMHKLAKELIDDWKTVGN